LTALLFVAARFVLMQCGASGAPGAAVPAPRAADSAPNRPASASTPGAGGSPSAGDEAKIASSVHVALGIPRDADPSDDHLLDEGSFVLSYSPTKRVPNWVAWRLDRSYFGSARRKDDFRPDRSLPARFYRVNQQDYLHSGYDRGHLCPSADREDSPADNSRTFLFTNIEPQLHELNVGPWQRLESYARQRAKRGQVLYLVAGGVFSAPFPTIGNGVAVPAANFKIVVFLHDRERVEDISEQTRVLAVLMPNQAGVGDHDWTEYLTSVDAIEQATGYDFLNAIPERVQRIIEARTDRP
jgi:endonuclease G